jgi:hypothetical protein
MLDRKSSNSDSRSDSFTKSTHARGRSIGHGLKMHKALPERIL